MSSHESPDRPDLYVVARILDRLWREHDAMLKTRLQVASRVNYDVFRRYLTWLLEKELVTVQNCEDGHERVALTMKGEKAYGTLVRWMDEVIHGKAPGS